jgi:sterol desaturase/sphingolipid hydroxylase (fatty acid hydroxylase superfamily)
MYIILLYLAAVIIIAELSAYLWHRYAAHTDYIPGLHVTHRFHHEAPLDHKADEDYVWVLLALVTVGIFLALLSVYRLISSKLAALFLTGVLGVFGWNWYVHSAYHQVGHWLEQYGWFKEMRELHFLHHTYPDKNYGIASHFMDVVMGTFQLV